MLVLSRKEEESILIPDLGVTIKVLQVQGGRIKLAIDAPKAIPIRRTECQPLSRPRAVSCHS